VSLFSGCSANKDTATKELVLGSNYDITATLDPYNRTLEYTAQVQVINDGLGSTKELYFHLYGNLFKTETEGIAVNSITDENGNTVTYELRDNDQLICIILNSSLGVGEETSVVFNCTVTIPDLISVFGVALDNEIHLPFFSPELAMYDENGWNINSLAQAGDGRYLAVSDYILTVQAPSEYEIVSNGVELSRESQSGKTTFVFRADQRREIVFTAFTDYIHVERIVGDTKIRGYFNITNKDINISVLDDIMDAAAFSMAYYNRIYMSYPFDTLTVMNAAWALKGTVVSMEYSGLFTLASFDEQTIYHEMAHQWFYFIVGNNEYSEPWLDEALATFSETLCIEAAGDTEGSVLWWEFLRSVSDRMQGEAVNRAYDEVDNHVSIFYHRGAYFIKELMDVIGKDRFLSILSEYCDTYAFRFATTEGFLDILREKSPVDIESIVREYIA
jgi:hypothetical protein